MKRSLLVLVWPLTLAGCAVFGPDDSVAGELRTHRRAWLQQHISDYRYDYQALCFCGNIDPIQIEVHDSQVTNATNKVTGETIPISQRGGLRTMPALYDYLIDAAGRADEMRADFDSEQHMPIEVQIDFARNTADDELIIKTSNLQIIESSLRVRAASPPGVAR